MHLLRFQTQEIANAIEKRAGQTEEGHHQEKEHPGRCLLSLEIRQISILQHLLNLQVDTSSGQDGVTLQYTEERETGRLHIVRRYAENIVGKIINIIGLLTNPPTQFPRLCSPLSKITVEHHQLLEIFTLIEHQTSSPPARIQMFLEDISGTINIRLTAGTLESPSTLALPGTDSTPIGPSLSLSLDYSAFHQILTGASEQIMTWQISIDRDATAVQFTPEMVRVSGNSGSTSYGTKKAENSPLNILVSSPVHLSLYSQKLTTGESYFTNR